MILTEKDGRRFQDALAFLERESKRPRPAPPAAAPPPVPPEDAIMVEPLRDYLLYRQLWRPARCQPLSREAVVLVPIDHLKHVPELSSLAKRDLFLDGLSRELCVVLGGTRIVSDPKGYRDEPRGWFLPS